MESYLRVNLLGPGPRLVKKEFTGRGLTKVEKHCFSLILFVLKQTPVKWLLEQWITDQNSTVGMATRYMKFTFALTEA